MYYIISLLLSRIKAALKKSTYEQVSELNSVPQKLPPKDQAGGSQRQGKNYGPRQAVSIPQMNPSSTFVFNLHFGPAQIITVTMKEMGGKLPHWFVTLKS